MNVSTAAFSEPRSVDRRPGQGEILARYILQVLPRVKKELRRWQSRADVCPDEVLRTQALSSLKNKDFHCYGGAVFAVGEDGQQEILIQLITAYQTVCDYLDNLCDRSDCLDGGAFRQLHAALLDALSPGGKKADYYALYTHGNDGGYLNELVEVCRQCLAKLPDYGTVQADALELAQLYIELQVTKHIDWTVRERQLIDWAAGETEACEHILWQEFAAATGSTLAIFALFALAARGGANREEARAVRDTYFPWICGLHILLDYFIDREEDRQGGDLNFTFYYADAEEMLGRLQYFVRQSRERLIFTESPVFTRTVVEGLLAMYLSDQKVERQNFRKASAALLNESSGNAWRVYRLCALVRRFF